MSERRVRERREDNGNQVDNDNGAFGMVLAGVGIGAAVYGISKWLGSGKNESNPSVSNHSVIYGNDSLKKHEPYKTDIIEMEDECEKVIWNIKSACKEYPVVGLDCEWSTDAFGVIVEGAVLSVCTVNGYCRILLLSDWDYMPPTLHSFLNDRSILKVGVGIDIDRKKLKDFHNLSLSGTVDLRFIAKENGYETRKLEYLAKEIAGITLKKQNWDHSQWGNRPLPPNNIHYATMDAYAGIEIIKKLSPSKQQVLEDCSKFIDKRFTTDMNNF